VFFEVEVEVGGSHAKKCQASPPCRRVPVLAWRPLTYNNTFCMPLAPLHRPAHLRIVLTPFSPWLSIRYMSCDTLQPRSHYKTPSHEDGGQNLPTDLNHRVYLRHPGYSDTGNILIVLPALDHPQGGIHHETARISCAIIANNRWEGFLAETKTGGPAPVGPDGILCGKNYYFRVSEDAADGKQTEWLLYTRAYVLTWRS
jgi:hypothetical protein